MFLSTEVGSPSSLRLTKRTMLPMITLSLLGPSLVVLRYLVTGHRTFFFMVYNLGLAWIPIGLSYLFARARQRNPSTRSRTLVLALGVSWLLFFPNAPYLLTDLVHVRPRSDAPYWWFDQMLFLSFALSGLLLGVESLAKMESALRPETGTGGLMLKFFAPGVLLLSSVGIHLGRFERWNSWDAILNPMSVIRSLSVWLLEPAASRYFFVGLVWLLLLATYRFVCGTPTFANRREPNN